MESKGSAVGEIWLFSEFGLVVQERGGFSSAASIIFLYELAQRYSKGRQGDRTRTPLNTFRFHWLLLPAQKTA